MYWCPAPGCARYVRRCLPGQKGVFHMATNYKLEGGIGVFDGATGALTNDGVADSHTGLVTLRYSGEVCTD